MTVQMQGPRSVIRSRVLALSCAAALLMSVGCSSGGDSPSSGDTKEAATTSPARTETPVDPYEAWSDTVAAVGPNTISTEPLLIGDELVAASAGEKSTTIQFWHFVDGQWREHSSAGLTGNTAFAGIKALTFIDVTGDASPELFADYWDIWDVAEIFLQGPNGWTGTGRNVQLTFAAGALSGADPFCVPSCDTPLMVAYDLRWSGAGFTKSSFDRNGAPVVIEETKECPTYTEIEFAPLSLCQAGDDVAILQAALQEQDFLYSVDGNRGLVDGEYGKSTATSVRLYQYANGFPVDGVAGGQWYYDLVDRYQSLHAADLPNYVTQACREALARVAPTYGGYTHSQIEATLENCEYDDWVDGAERWRAKDSDFFTAVDNGGADRRGHFILLKNEDAETALWGFCAWGYYYTQACSGG